jgi:hypothetical protein
MDELGLWHADPARFSASGQRMMLIERRGIRGRDAIMDSYSLPYLKFFFWDSFRRSQ